MKVVHILLLEDDSLDIIDIQRTLDKMNILYRLQVAKNGEDGLALLEQMRRDGEKGPDIVLIDINMPKMNGLEFLSIVRNSEEWKKLKCFIITTSEDRIDKEAAKALGVSGYVVKPFKLNNRTSMDSFNLMIDLMNMKD
ncbi:response regulator [Paracnuella aquatica]|uniref:response regulator n=1 Tax=Paracnuella aquatica TaxID=2268757 RepID=UPI000DEF50E4|nr:response regulator [Paracnuella aquatica]RPD48223.1 response regulator [Paracnuella aquatica]